MKGSAQQAEYWDKLEAEFQRFIQFGQLLDTKTREYLVQYLRTKLDQEAELPPLLKRSYYTYFCEALDGIFEADFWQTLLKDHTQLATQVTQDTLQWMRKAYRDMKTDSPYEEELDRLGSYNVMPQRRWATAWYAVTNYLKSVYDREALDVGFYEQKFKGLLGKRNFEELEPADRKELRRISQDLLAQWDARLQANVLAYQLKRLKKEQDAYKDLLEAKMEEFQKLQRIIQPFADYSGMYWDLSQDLWKKTSFDVLQRYRELLEAEDSLRELVDKLGKMREAELALEEETYERVIVQQQWYEDTRLRTEIVGIHESDDLNTVLSGEVETAFLQKYADKSLLTFEFEDKELVTSSHEFTEVDQRVKRREKGPFILCVDTSDSMSGAPEQIAKVLCFAILKMAAEDNRRAYLINFSVGIQVLDLFNIAQSLDSIAEFLTMSFQAGTDISLAMYEAFRQLEGKAYKDADVLVISDYVMYELDVDIISRMQYFQQNKGTLFHSLILNTVPNKDVVKHFDNVWIYEPEKKGIMRTLAGDLQVLKGK